MNNIQQIFYITIFLIINSQIHAANICVPDTSPGGCDSTQTTIELAVTSSMPGDTITLAAGNFDTAAQVVIDKNLTLTGAGAANSIINSSFDTSTAGDPRGWFLVNPTIVFNVNNVAFDGTGQLIYQGIRHRGSGTVDNVAFSNIQYNASGPNYQGVAIAAFGDAATNVTNSSFDAIGRIGILYFGTGVNGSVFDNNTYMGKGIGDFLDYGLEVGGGAVVEANNNRIENNFGIASSDGSTSAAILVTTFFGPGSALDLVSNTIVNSSNGVIVGFDAMDTSTVTAHCNVIVGNTSDGIRSTAATVDARENWWGCNAGPNMLGCDDIGMPGMVNSIEWLVLSLTPGQTTMNLGDPSTTLTADLTGDSGGGISTGAPFNCTIPDGTQINFDGGALGTVMPATVGTSNGVAVSNFTPTSAGTANDISVVTNDGGETVTTQIMILSADLSITKTDNVTSATPGGSLTYSIVASNAGPSDDPTVSVIDTFPAQLTCTYTSVNAGGATGNTAAGSGNLTETLSMPNGSTVTYTATCDIAPNATGTLSNTAMISGTVSDSQTGNNSATDNDTVLSADADLSIAITGPANVSTPGTITYTIDVTNSGPSDATNVIVNDLLSVNAFTVETVGCQEDPAGYPICNLGTIVSGGMASYTVTFTVGSINGDISNNASVTSDASDANTANNAAASTIFGTPITIPTLNQWLLYLLILLIVIVTYSNTRTKFKN